MSDPPDEPRTGSPGPEDEGGEPAEPEVPLRGWIDPDDRLWRHPSELAADPADGPVLLSAPTRHRFRGPLMVLIGAAAVMAVVAWVIVLLSPSSAHPTATTQDTASDTALTGGEGTTIPAPARAAGRSMVQLRARTDHGTFALVGVAVAEGGLVVTTADLLHGLTSIALVGANGRTQPATLVAVDKTSDIALVDVPAALPVAPFADDTALANGAADLTMSLAPSGGAALVLHCTPGQVTGVATAIANGPAAGMPAITTSVPSSAPVAGDPVLNAAGSVIGILYDPVPGSGAATTFLPAPLVVGVADDLRSDSRVVHGWLGVSGTDVASGTGAKVAGVETSGPAAGKLKVGQVITAVNALPVRTMAELRARLYVLAPETPVAVSVQDGSSLKVVDVTLSGTS